ncbi:ferredoxin [Jatrophihabitans sp.]|uniref:ferredoxin n=1 Tax=Jatrophihabitans sp. TaxID=1932789 RepID=UPI0030C66A85|nr:ferredoxin [Jatrophihabitans sp.]
MKVHVDVSRCESNAVCLAMAPEVFDLGDDGLVTLLVEDVDDALRSRVEGAVAGCPREVISLVEQA